MSVPAAVLSVSVVLAVSEPWAFEIMSVSQFLSCDRTLSLSACQNVCVGTCWDFFGKSITELWWNVEFVSLSECLCQYLQRFCQWIQYILWWNLQFARMFASVPARILSISQLLSCDGTLSLSECLLVHAWILSVSTVLAMMVAGTCPHRLKTKTVSSRKKKRKKKKRKKNCINKTISKQPL